MATSGTSGNAVGARGGSEGRPVEGVRPGLELRRAVLGLARRVGRRGRVVDLARRRVGRRVVVRRVGRGGGRSRRLGEGLGVLTGYWMELLREARVARLVVLGVRVVGPAVGLGIVRLRLHVGVRVLLLVGVVVHELLVLLGRYWRRLVYVLLPAVPPAPVVAPPRAPVPAPIVIRSVLLLLLLHPARPDGLL